ncbi:MAG: helix-hairpin-helix domain-containing protein [Thermaceae bacterium]|nr:helix-hairpin-helix domain-containing protein [Thermaceae bacterium]
MKRNFLVLALASLAIAGASVLAQKTTTPSSTMTATACKVTPVNVNTATTADLDKIPGIGMKTAEAIIKARPFKDEADLVAKVKGIGEKNIVKFRACFLYK